MSAEVGEDLPLGWVETTLGEISDVQGGVTKNSKNQSDDDEEFPYLRVANVQRGYLDLTEMKTIRIPAIRAEKMLLKSGDILFNEGGDADKLGRGWVWEGQIDRCSFQNHVFRARLYDDNIQAKYISMWGNSRGLEFFLRNAKQTTNLASINRSMLVQLPISLPPLAEQIRIADKLDALLSRVDAGRERLERVPKLVKRFRQSVLSAAVSGELTREWRGGGDAEWEEIRLLEISSLITKGSSPRWQGFEYTQSGSVFVTSENVRDMKVDLSDPKYLDEKFNSLQSRSTLKKGDLLLNIVGASIGRSCQFNLDIVANINQAVALIRLNNRCKKKFILICLNSATVLNQIHHEKVDVARANLSLADVGGLKFNLPPLPEQAEIVRRVEALFAIADRLEARAQAALFRYSRLTPALLAKAFRGELVPQDPADEPASVLLERIKAQREAAGPAKKAAGRGRRPGATTPTANDGAQAREPKRRGRPRKVVTEDAVVPRRGRGSIPTAGSYEEAVRLLEAQGKARAEGTRQGGLFSSEQEEIAETPVV
jgi:type I restriction enzyme, S subunit